MSPMINNDGAMEFLAGLIPGGPWHLVAISPDGPVVARTFDSSAKTEMRNFINSVNGRKNIYCHVNVLRSGLENAKAKKEDIALARYAHIDIDDLDGLDRLREFRPPPTAVVCSGGGYNAYWMLEEPTDDCDRVEGINRWLVAQLAGDKVAVDVSRILRVPGTTNIPTKTKLARGRIPVASYVVKELTDWSVAYQLDDFSEISVPTVSIISKDAEPLPLVPAAIPSDLDPRLIEVCKQGDDPKRPRGGPAPRYHSRSEAVFAVACGLARIGYDVEAIAAVLINPAHGVSASLLQKRNPAGEARRQARKALMRIGEVWPNGLDRDNKTPKKGFQNTQAALLRLGCEFRFDTFRNRMFVEGEAIQFFAGELNDRVCLALRDLIEKQFGFDCGREMVRDAVEQLCNQNVVDPVRDYLDGLSWDRVPRIDQWLVRYAGCEDLAYVRAVGAIMLIAAVRRPRQPGVKFDTIPVLEGAQGTGKSTMLGILAGQDFFSDQDILALDPKAQMEALEGVWLFELCELAGMRYTDVNKIKAFASRAVDRARPAYGRFSEIRRRRGILVGTTNDEHYLKDHTGNRRFWPIATGEIDLLGLAEVRDQLWAEAAHREASGEEIVLPEDLWPAAEAEQNKRLEPDGWEIPLEGMVGTFLGGRELVASQHILAGVLELPPGQVQSFHYRRLSTVMKTLGWQGPTTITLTDGKKVKGYWRPTQLPDGFDPSPI